MTIHVWELQASANQGTGSLVLIKCLKFITFDPVVLVLEIYSSEIEALVEMAMFMILCTAVFSVEEKGIQKSTSTVHQQGKC